MFYTSLDMSGVHSQQMMMMTILINDASTKAKQTETKHMCVSEHDDSNASLIIRMIMIVDNYGRY